MNQRRKTVKMINLQKKKMVRIWNRMALRNTRETNWKECWATSKILA
jgi:hypothetical protein